MPTQLTKDPFGDNNVHLRAFPDSTLLDIARNGSAQQDYRLLAVEILQTRKSPKIKHPDIQDLVRELEIELDGIVFENPAPSSGPLVASVTTKTLQEAEIVDMEKLRKQELSTQELSSEETQLDVPPTDSDPVPAQPEIKPRKPRKPKEPVDDPKPE